eukprot:scaffold7381_cov310-Pinguiococcus_pyrenoidosus.AAC.113
MAEKHQLVAPLQGISCHCWNGDQSCEFGVESDCPAAVDMRVPSDALASLDGGKGSVEEQWRTEETHRKAAPKSKYRGITVAIGRKLTAATFRRRSCDLSQ